MSSDRLSELQSRLDFLSQMFFTSVGVLQRDAPPSPLEATGVKGESSSNFRDIAADMAQQIARTAKSIHDLIDSLPGGASASESQQLATLENLEKENLLVGRQLQEKVAQAEVWLVKVREALRIIGDDRFSES